MKKFIPVIVKKFIPVILVGLVTFILTGCYTQILMENVDDNYTYSEPVPIIIIEPAPPPVIIYPIIVGPHPNPRPPKYVIRNPKPSTKPGKTVRDPIRNSGGRNGDGRRNK